MMSGTKPSQMKCKECDSTGAPYKLSYGGVYLRTCMAFYPFVDDDGKRHYHDGNRGGGEYWSCSNGHYVNEEERPSCWCGWPISGVWAEADRKRREESEERRAAKAAALTKDSQS